MMQFIKYLLAPAGFLYGLVMDMRNFFYDRGIFKVHKFDIPIISVGNITAGGTGKTPFVIWLAKNLSAKYKKIAVISRGYGRESKGMLIVENHHNPRFYGDEPSLTAVSLPGAKVLVSEDRKEAIKYVVQNNSADLIILDDAFQHRSVQRDADIVLLNAKERLRCNFPIPAGSLREFKHNLKRADILILTNTEHDFPDENILPPKPLFKSKGYLKTVVDYNFNEAADIEAFAGKRVAAFSAIAHPENFKEALQKHGIIIEKYFAFRDHYAYKPQDIHKIAAQAREASCNTILCTEKDIVKIAALKESAPKDMAMFYAVKLETQINEKEILLKKILDHIDKRTK